MSQKPEISVTEQRALNASEQIRESLEHAALIVINLPVNPQTQRRIVQEIKYSAIKLLTPKSELDQGESNTQKLTGASLLAVTQHVEAIQRIISFNTREHGRNSDGIRKLPQAPEIIRRTKELLPELEIAIEDYNDKQEIEKKLLKIKIIRFGSKITINQKTLNLNLNETRALELLLSHAKVNKNSLLDTFERNTKIGFTTPQVRIISNLKNLLGYLKDAFGQTDISAESDYLSFDVEKNTYSINNIELEIDSEEPELLSTFKPAKKYKSLAKIN